MPTDPHNRICPHCRFAYHSRGGRCWLCGEMLPPIEQAPLAPTSEEAAAADTATGGHPVEAWTFRDPPTEGNPYAAPPSGVVGESTFTLSSLFLFVTLVAVCLGVIGLAPGLGIPLAIVTSLALVRTVAASRRRQYRRGLSTGEKIVTFLGSAALVTVILSGALVAFSIAFFAACSAVAVGPWGDQRGFIAGVIAGGIVALPLTYFLFRVTWPKKRDTKPSEKS